MIYRYIIIAILLLSASTAHASVIGSFEPAREDLIGYAGQDGTFSWNVTGITGQAYSVALLLTATTSCFGNTYWQVGVQRQPGATMSYSAHTDKEISAEMQLVMLHFSSTTVVTLSGALQARIDIDLNSCGDIMGVASTTGGFTPWYIIYNDPDLEFADTRTGVYWKNIMDIPLPQFPYTLTGCLSDMTACFYSLIIPDASSTGQIFTVFKDNVMTLSPWGYPTLIFNTLFDYDATSTLPSLIFTVPPGLPQACQTLDLTPWGNMAGDGSYLSTVVARGDTIPFMERVLPYWNFGWKLMFAFAIFRLVTKSHLFGTIASVDQREANKFTIYKLHL